jgi:hypothetical protein
MGGGFMKRLTVLILMLFLLLSTICLAEEGGIGSGLIVSIGGESAGNMTLDAALGIKVTDRVILQGQIGSTHDGEARFGFGPVFRLTDYTFINLTASPMEDPDEETIELNAGVLGGGVYIPQIKLGAYAGILNDFSNGEKTFQYRLFIWVPITEAREADGSFAELNCPLKYDPTKVPFDMLCQLNTFSKSVMTVNRE